MPLLSMSPALAAICGSMAGALGSSANTWITQRHEDRRDLLARKIFQREQLYSDFITESTRILVDALENSFENSNKLIAIYALLNRIRLGSSTQVLEVAEEVVREVITMYGNPNLTPEQIRLQALKGNDPLMKRFSEVCRAELDSMENRL